MPRTAQDLVTIGQIRLAILRLREADKALSQLLSTKAGKAMASIDNTLGIPKFGGDIWYVNNADGADTNTGKSPTAAFQTIGAAITAMGDGDAVVIAQGTYAENVVLSNTGAELWFEIGAIIAPAAGVALTVSGNYCRVTCREGALRVNAVAAQTGVIVSGSFCYLAEIRVPCASSGNIGFDITGSGADLRRCRCSAPLVAAFKIQGDKVKLEDCCTGAEVADASIGFWVTNSCDKARLRRCSSQGNSTAGFQFDTGCTNILAKNCDSGGGDGHFIDNATLTYLDVQDKDSREFHEHVYPTPDGMGTAGAEITVNNTISDETGSQSDQNYFGDPKVIIDVATITTDWFLKGVNIYATTINDVQKFRLYRVEYDVSATRNGGNNWDENETVLTFDDASGFESGDLIWISTSGYKPDGEIVEITNIAGNVVTVARQTELSGRLGLHWDHTTNDPGNEVAYLCWRDENNYHSSDFDFSTGSARDHEFVQFIPSRRLHANDGLIARMINATDDGDSSADLTIAWSD